MNNVFPLARYRFTWRVTHTLALPDYAGSALRGAFGHALRQLACVTKAKECAECPLLAQCPYPQVFSPHDIPRTAHADDKHWFSTMVQIPAPYVIEPPAWGRNTLQPDAKFSFNMVLFGDALAQLPLIILAWRRALLRGLTRSEGKAELQRVEWLPDGEHGQTIYQESSPVIVAHEATLSTLAPTTPHNVHIELVSPLRVQRDKKILSARELTAGIFIRNLIRRVSLLKQFHLHETTSIVNSADTLAAITALNTLADNLHDERRLKWQEWKRYSTRQRQEMALGGVMGHWLLKQVPPELYTYLYLGQWLHIGKETVFGLGHYRIVTAPWQPIERLHSEQRSA